MTTQIKRQNFNGLVVGSLESRMKEEMSRLIQNQNGIPFVAPSVKEATVDEHGQIKEFGDQLLNGKIDVLILMTGVGTRALVKNLTPSFPIETIKEALKKTTLVVRGPKPLKALGELDLKPSILVPEPNTWREILKTLDEKNPIENKNVVVQEYGEPNKIFLAELGARGAHVSSIFVYKAVMPDNTEPLGELIQKTIAGEIKVLLFTNATQVTHLMRKASQMGLREQLRRSLSSCVVASVGPTATEALHSFGLPVDIEPERPMMGALVTEVAQKASDMLKSRTEENVNIRVRPKGLTQAGDPLHASLLLKACRREQTERTPIWLMRQAGRYMKEYRELRAKVSFLDLCKNSDLASEVTVEAAHRLDVDAAIIFSDILLPLEPLGFELTYEKNDGPVINNPFSSKDDLKRMTSVDVLDSLRFTYEAIHKTRKTLKPHTPLIGFVGAPFTLASYLIEGKSSRQFIKTKLLMSKDPPTWNKLMEKITDVCVDHLNEQIHAGCQVVQIFDSWVGCLTPSDFEEYVLPHTKRLISSLTPGIPVISFGTNTSGFLPQLKQAGGDVIGLDWRVELDEAWEKLGDVAVMGNMDPTLLFTNPKEIEKNAKRILNQAAGKPGHIFNLGHGVLPETPIENVLALIEAVKKESKR